MKAKRNTNRNAQVHIGSATFCTSDTGMGKKWCSICLCTWVPLNYKELLSWKRGWM